MWDNCFSFGSIHCCFTYTCHCLESSVHIASSYYGCNSIILSNSAVQIGGLSLLFAGKKKFTFGSFMYQDGVEILWMLYRKVGFTPCVVSFSSFNSLFALIRSGGITLDVSCSALLYTGMVYQNAGLSIWLFIL